MTAEDLLTRTFTEVTDATEYAATPMGSVVSRFETRRRARRRTTALVAAATVVLVGGVSTLAVRGGDDSTPAPTGPLGDIRQGPAPRIGYLEGDTFVTTSGLRFTAPVLARAEDAVAWRNGVLVAGRLTLRHPYSTITFVTGSSTSNVGCGQPGFAVPTDGGAPTYWLYSRCKMIIKKGTFVRGTTYTDTPKGAVVWPIGNVAGGIVVAASAYELRVESPVLVIPRDNGHWVALPLRIPRGASEATDLVSGEGERIGSSLVVDASSGAVRWRAHAWTLGKFSTSGRYVVGDQEVGKQPEPDVGDVIGIFDAVTGRQILRKELPGLTFDTQPVWEGDDSVLVVAEDDQGREAIVRVALDGTVTRATAVVPWTPRPASGRPPVPWFRPGATP